MKRNIGTMSIGVRCPIIREGDDLAKIVVDSVLAASKEDSLPIEDKDIIAVTESVLARAQGNYANVTDIADDIQNIFGGKKHVGVVFPILSRNRFSLLLKGIARGASKVTIVLSYPSDEVGNGLINLDLLDEKNVDPFKDVFTLEEWRKLFGVIRHPFTGMDYPGYYKEFVEAEGAECEIILANDPRAVLKYTKNVIAADIHTAPRTIRLIKKAGAEKVIGLADILSKSVNGSGYNSEHGLLGSNKADEDRVKLFPRDGMPFVMKVQEEIKKLTGKTVEVMVYGDGAFKDPIGGIWELADPVVSPFHTPFLDRTPNELKLKYLADGKYKDLSGEALSAAIAADIKEKDANLFGKMTSEGTTPRKYADLIGSLCDLTSGSGDKGTPIVWIRGYFDNMTSGN